MMVHADPLLGTHCAQREGWGGKGEGYSLERGSSALAPALQGELLADILVWGESKLLPSPAALSLPSPGSAINFLGGALERLGGCLATQQDGWLPSV